jgi:hypothetical protein
MSAWLWVFVSQLEDVPVNAVSQGQDSDIDRRVHTGHGGGLTLTLELHRDSGGARNDVRRSCHCLGVEEKA